MPKEKNFKYFHIFTNLIDWNTIISVLQGKNKFLHNYIFFIFYIRASSLHLWLLLFWSISSSQRTFKNDKCVIWFSSVFDGRVNLLQNWIKNVKIIFVLIKPQNRTKQLKYILIYIMFVFLSCGTLCLQSFDQEPDDLQSMTPTTATTVQQSVASPENHSFYTPSLT